MADLDRERFWDCIERGDWEVAAHALTIKIEAEPNQAAHFANRGTCLLALHQFEGALSDFQRALDLCPEVEGCPIKLGVVLWWLNRPTEAVDIWRKGLGAEYLDAAGGVTTPALLFFAAIRLRDPALEKEAQSWLRKRWKPSLAKVWPGPIAGYLLGKMDEDTFLTQQTFLNPILEARRLAKAHFWVGFQCFRHGDHGGYQWHLRQAIQDEAPEHRAVILEPEFWLAQAELELNAEAGDTLADD